MTITLPSAAPTYPIQWLDELRRVTPVQPAWLWHGYLAPGNVTLLTSQWKVGKTSLLSALLHCMKAGGELAGLPVLPGKAVVLSEESPTLWLQRSEKLDLAGHVAFSCRPFRGRPRHEEWQALLNQILALHTQVGLDLLAVDPLASFLPSRSENDATSIMEALLPLQRLTAAGMAVFLPHHPRKQSSPDGASARGSGALPAWADILMELRWFNPRAPDDRRRRLLAWSRHDATPRTLLIERTADGLGYVPCAEPEPSEPAPEDDELTASDSPLWEILEETNVKQSRRDILRRWPRDSRPPERTKLWRFLERLFEQGKLRRDGAGVRKDPFRYWLPSLEQRWETDVVARTLQHSCDEALRMRREGRLPYASDLPMEDDDKFEDDE